MFNALSPWHLLLIGVLLLLFYGNRLPEVARSLGKAVNEFKRGLKDVGEEMNRDEQPPARDRLDAPHEEAAPTVTPTQEATKEPVGERREQE